MAVSETEPIARGESHLSLVTDNEITEDAESSIDFARPKILFEGDAVERNRAELAEKIAKAAAERAHLANPEVLADGSQLPLVTHAEMLRDAEAADKRKKVVDELGFYGAHDILLDRRRVRTHLNIAASI